MRKAVPELAHATNGRITDILNDLLRHELRDPAEMITVDGQLVGPYDATFYVNPDSWDIRRIRPYSAYDVGADVWVVKPPDLPEWSLDKFPPAVTKALKGAETYAKDVLKLPEPQRTQQGAALFDAWHSDRSRAFSDRGQGWWDFGNLREKWLDQTGIWVKLVDCKHRDDQGLGAPLPDWSTGQPFGLTAGHLGLDDHEWDELSRVQDVREQSHDPRECFQVSRHLHDRLGWDQASGHYRGTGHYWNVKSDGTIIDATHDQFEPDEDPVKVVPGASGSGSLQDRSGGRPKTRPGAAADPDTLFGDAPTAPTPWPNAGRSKSRRDYDPDVVKDAIANPEHHHLQDIDPRDLRSTQPAITRGGVQHYLSDHYDRTGETFADHGNPGNRRPVVYRREDGQNLLLSGHHRATAALLQGRPLQAVVVHGPWGPDRRTAAAEQETGSVGMDALNMLYRNMV